jgi:5'-deoxynucleotidase YfbR-like HD superfamily hydrolase
MINELLKLMEFSQKFASITRTVKIADRVSYESDAEHSYQLGLIAWYVAEKHNLGLDKGKILEYAAVHDLVEVYAGDTDPHLSTKEVKLLKDAREREARERISKDFPDFPSLHSALLAYEKHQDKESRLVYIVDKILPIINTHLTNHAYYIDANVSFETWHSWLQEKMQKVNAEELLGKQFFTDVIAFFKSHPEMFAKS